MINKHSTNNRKPKSFHSYHHHVISEIYRVVYFDTMLNKRTSDVFQRLDPPPPSPTSRTLFLCLGKRKEKVQLSALCLNTKQNGGPQKLTNRLDIKIFHLNRDAKTPKVLLLFYLTRTCKNRHRL